MLVREEFKESKNGRFLANIFFANVGHVKASFQHSVNVSQFSRHVLVAVLFSTLFRVQSSGQVKPSRANHV